MCSSEKNIFRISTAYFLLYKYSGSLLLSVGDTFQDPQWMPETMNSTKLSLYCFYPYSYMLLHLKETFYGFSLAYLSCQHHYSCTLGPLVNKMWVT